MSALTGQSINTSYTGLIKTTDNAPITGTLKALEDGAGNTLPIEVSSTGVNFTGTVTGIDAPGLVAGTGVESMQSSASLTTPGADAQGDSSVAIGENAKTSISGTQATAVGWNCTANGSQSTALGSGSGAYASRAVAVGQSADASGFGAVAIGNSSTASGESAIMIGGYVSSASGNFSIAMGRETKATAADTISMGRLTNVNSSGAIAIGQGAGQLTVGANNNWASVALGQNAKFNANGCVAIGGATDALGTGAIAIGDGTQASNNSISIGAGSNASGSRSICIGDGGIADGPSAVFIGKGGQASDNSVGIGDGSVSIDGGTAVGGNSRSTGVNGTAIGRFTDAQASGSVALGNGVTATIADTVSMKALELQTNSTPTVGGIIMSDAGGTDRRLNITATGGLQIDSTPVGGGSAPSYSFTTPVSCPDTGSDQLLVSFTIPGGTFTTGDVVMVKGLWKNTSGTNTAQIWISNSNSLFSGDPVAVGAGSQPSFGFMKSLYIAGTSDTNWFDENFPADAGSGNFSQYNSTTLNWASDVYIIFQGYVDPGNAGSWIGGSVTKLA